MRPDRLPVNAYEKATVYHLLVSASDDRWDHGWADMSALRCLRTSEFTPAQLAEEFGTLSKDSIRQLVQLPALFAYETTCDRDARVGQIHAIARGDGRIRLDYTLLPAYPPIPNDKLKELELDLGLQPIELYREHWALKKADLSDILQHAGFPAIPFGSQPLINIRSHIFDVGLSFPGNVRDYVKDIASLLVRSIGRNSVFYDNYYKSQLAGPNLDTLLQAIYRKRSRLVVAFLSQGYKRRKWCGIEFRAIREIINAKRDQAVMFIRHDNVKIDGVFSHDGFIDANAHTASEVAAMIHERVLLLKGER